MNISLLIVAVLPSIIIALVIYYHDRHEREPFSLLARTFLLGALAIIPTMIIENLLLRFNIFVGILASAYLAFMVSGFTEEYLKRWVVLRVVYSNKEFNEKLDGIAYSVYVALGFATVENIMYVVNHYSFQPLIGLYRGIFSVPAHCLFAITMGYYLSLAKFSKEPTQKKKHLSKSLWIPVIFHGIFNFILLSKVSYLMFFFIPFVIYLWMVNVRKLRVYANESKGQNHNIRE